MTPIIENIADFSFGDEVIIDVRTPSEFAEDHFPGAVNLPVLTDDQFKTVGTLYKEKSPFDASKLGAAMVSKNIAAHLEEFLREKPHNTKLVFYCARGGKRSRSFAQVCSMIGWQTGIVEGGYKSYRRQVSAGIEELCGSLEFVLIAGKTGTGKTAVLGRLEELGCFVLDLEKLAVHRGSILGAHKSKRQPSQKFFETRIHEELKKFSDKKRIFVEAESSKIGELFIPVPLWKSMKKSPIFVVENLAEHRVQYILNEYDPAFLKEQAIPNLLGFLQQKLNVIDAQKLEDMVTTEDWQGFVGQLLASHYDPLYDFATLKRQGNILECIQVNRPVKESIEIICDKILGSFR